MYAALGYILLIASGTIAVPLVVIPFYPNESVYSIHFAAPATLLAAAGLILVLRTRKRRPARQLKEREGAIVVTVGWIIANLVSAWPFIGIAGLNFSQAFFEAMSGWTTTGLSMVDVEHVPHILLFFRSAIQLAGGAGLAIIMMAAFSLPVGAGIYRAEGRNYQLVPHVTRSAKIVITLYLGYTLVGTLVLAALGMDFFDAINHAFCAVSTGGFSTKSASIGYWNSAKIEAAILVLMILGNLNFLTAYILFTGKIRTFLRNAEMKIFAIFSVLGISLLFVLFVRTAYSSLGKEIRVSVFEAISALTTTGFSTVSYAQWNGPAILTIIVLMTIGGGMCSTAGGLKQYRVYIMLKAVVWEIQRMILPKRAVVVHRAFVGDEESVVESRQIMEVGVFVFLYLATYATGTLILGISGYSIREAAFEFASALGTVGLSVGVISTGTPLPALWTMTAGMFLGRLEFFVILVTITQIFKRSNSRSSYETLG